MPETEPHQPAKPHLRATLILACLAQFMVILDISVVTVALPSIKHALGFTESDLQWVINGYAVAFAGFLLLGGRATDLLGRRRVFVVGVATFALASLIGGLAMSRGVLVGARVLQGLGGAVVGPSSLALLTTTFTDTDERNHAIGIWGAMAAAGGAAGTLLGGTITELLGWRWILFINVPIGLVVAVCAQRLLLEGRSELTTRNFDLAGALSVTVGLTSLAFGFSRTAVVGWGDPTAIVPIIVGVLLIGLFLLIEGKLATAPLMPLRLFQSRTLSAANAITGTLGAASYPMWFFATLYLQEVKGFSAIETGVAFLPMTLCLVIGAPICSRLMGRLDPRRLLVGGMALLTIGMFLLSRMGVEDSYWTGFLPASLLVSIGMTMTFIPGTILGTSGVAPHEAGLASGVLNTSRLVAGSIGLAVLAALAASHTSSLLAHPTSGTHTLQEALVSGFQLAFTIGAGIALAGMFVAYFAMPKQPTRAQPDSVAVAAVEV